MKNILLDTDVLIEFLRGNESVRDLLLSIVEENAFCCSAITVAEIYAGMREGEKEPTDNLLNGLYIVEVNRAVAEKAGIYRNKIRQQRLELDDCIIAACAFSMDAVVFTCNGKHYPMNDIEKRIVPLKKPHARFE